MKKTIYQFALIFITLSFLTACTGNIDSESENKGIQHYKNGNIKKQFPYWRKLKMAAVPVPHSILEKYFVKVKALIKILGDHVRII